MSIYSISDLHLSENNSKPMDIFGPVWDGAFEKIKTDWQNRVNDEDIVLLAGDLSWAMKLEEAEKDIKLLSNLKGKKIIIKGNHDYWWQSLTQLRQILPPNFYALQNDAIKIGDYIFCGTRGWVIPEGKFKTEENIKIFAREGERLKLSLNCAKKLQTNNEKIICLMHYPPFNAKMENSAFTQILEEFGVSVVVFGHIHGNKYGYHTICEKNNIKYYLTSCDLLKNQLIKII
mgnify:CR=1 FL=1